MEHQFFIRQQNLKLYRSLVAASEAAAAKADARQEKLLKLTPSTVHPPFSVKLSAPRPTLTSALRYLTASAPSV
jgi:hypothetical protein